LVPKISIFSRQNRWRIYIKLKFSLKGIVVKTSGSKFAKSIAFAAYYLATEKELGLNRKIANVNGSGISLGHPVGSTGCRILVTLLYEMERQGLNLGISSLCAGGGVGTAILVER
jgi:acetyl-CoA acetyltransferase